MLGWASLLNRAVKGGTAEVISEQEFEEREAVSQGVIWDKGVEAQSITYKVPEQGCVWDI